MTSDVAVKLKGMAPTPQGAAIFLTDGLKVMAVFVDHLVASAISISATGFKTPRPLTHDLVLSMLLGLGARIEKVVIHALEDSTFLARIYLIQENELGRQIAEIDARPSDSIALALRQPCPIFVNADVWAQVEDMTWAFEQAMRPPDEPADDQEGKQNES